MNFWTCACGKKVSKNITVCPYCKTDTAPVTSSAPYPKLFATAALVAVVTGAYMLGAKKDVSSSSVPEPRYITTKIVNGPSQAQTTQKLEVTTKIVPQTAIDAIDALSKLRAKTQVGIAYKDYGPALGDVKFYINKFTESSQSKEFPLLVESVEKSFDIFKIAGEIWSLKFNGNSGVEEFTTDFSPGSPGWQVTKYFPGANKDMSEGGLMVKDSLHISSAISFLFSEANKELQKAAGMVAH